MEALFSNRSYYAIDCVNLILSLSLFGIGFFFIRDGIIRDDVRFPLHPKLEICLEIAIKKTKKTILSILFDVHHLMSSQSRRYLILSLHIEDV